MKRKFKQWWSSNPPISIKQKITSHLNWIHWTQKKTHDIWRWPSRPWIERHWFKSFCITHCLLLHVNGRHFNIYVLYIVTKSPESYPWRWTFDIMEINMDLYTSYCVLREKCNDIVCKSTEIVYTRYSLLYNTYITCILL